MTAEISAIICSAITAASVITVAVVEARAARERKRTAARAERREKESRLSMELMSVSCDLAVVTAVAMREGHTNGTLEPALQKASKAQEAYQAFLRDEAAHAVAKV